MTPRERHGLWVTGELWVIPPVPTSDGPKSMGYRKLWVIRRYGLWGVRLYQLSIDVRPPDLRRVTAPDTVLLRRIAAFRSMILELLLGTLIYLLHGTGSCARTGP